MKKRTTVILIIVGIIIAISAIIIDMHIFKTEKPNKLESLSNATENLIDEAKLYIKSNENMYGKNIYDKLKQPEDATDGAVFVNKDLQVSIAVIYDDICYIKLYNATEITNDISPKSCIKMVELDNQKNLNEDIKDENDDDNEDVVIDKEENSNINYDEGLEKNTATELYNKYIKYSKMDINAYENIDVNEDVSNEYMVKLAIYNIIKDNNVNIEDYSWYNRGEYNEGWRDGYRINTNQIENYINKLFNVNKVINYGELDLGFFDNISIHYYTNEGAYSLISDSSIPKSDGSFDIYSKYINSETNGDNIIVYSNYFAVVGDIGMSYVEDKINDEKIYELCYSTLEDDYICPVGSNESDVEYVISKLSQQVGKFKHTFTKKEDGNYYWVSTQKIN